MKRDDVITESWVPTILELRQKPEGITADSEDLEAVENRVPTGAAIEESPAEYSSDATLSTRNESTIRTY